MVRTELPPETILPELRRAVGEVDRLPQNIGTMWERMSSARATPRFQAMLLGADRSSVLRMVLAQGIRVSLVGLALGMVATLALSRVLAAFLYDMEPYDPLTLVAVALVLVLVSAAACLTPARRATAIDPVRVLNAE